MYKHNNIIYWLYWCTWTSQFYITCNKDNIGKTVGIYWNNLIFIYMEFWIVKLQYRTLKRCPYAMILSPRPNFCIRYLMRFSVGNGTSHHIRYTTFTCLRKCMERDQPIWTAWLLWYCFLMRYCDPYTMLSHCGVRSHLCQLQKYLLNSSTISWYRLQLFGTKYNY